MRVPVQLLVALMLSLPLHAGAQAPALRSGEFTPPRMAPDFTLSGSDGQALRLSAFRGKVVALGFGFTSCPEICPTTLFELASARKKLGDDARDFQVVYVTVDPETDTVERLRAYMSGFDAAFLGATGSPDKLAAVRKAYGVAAGKVQGAGRAPTFNHSTFVYLIDRQGRLRAMSPYGRKVDDLVQDIRVLLRG